PLGAYFATLWTVYVRKSEPKIPAKKSDFGRVISTPTRSQLAPSAFASTCCEIPVPSSVPFMSELVSRTGLVTVTVVASTVMVAVRAPVLHVPVIPAHAVVTSEDDGCVPPRLRNV